MKLKEYLDVLNIDAIYFSNRVGISKGALYRYISGIRVPTQEIAENIEELTLGVVSVKDLRGKDDRLKSSKFRHSDSKTSL